VLRHVKQKWGIQHGDCAHIMHNGAPMREQRARPFQRLVVFLFLLPSLLSSSSSSSLSSSSSSSLLSSSRSPPSPPHHPHLTLCLRDFSRLPLTSLSPRMKLSFGPLLGSSSEFRCSEQSSDEEESKLRHILKSPAFNIS